MNAVDQAIDLIHKRLLELSEEEDGLRRAIKELGGTDGRKRPGRPAGGRSGAPSAPKSTPAKRAPKGQRRKQFLDEVEKAGPAGITVAAAAKIIGVKPQPLYAVARDLEAKDEVKKDGPRYMTPTNAGAMPPKEPKGKPAKPKAKGSKATKPKGGKGAEKDLATA